jgi:hypothetical protein
MMDTKCCCKCHIKTYEDMNKWELIQEVKRYGRIRYAASRTKADLIKLLRELRNGNGHLIPREVPPTTYETYGC